uniref:Uncharacterized protein n=1 Tax=Cacopsylla melanoneura TaxID=428564 RepID=A0A8D8M617_9HEMI
MVCCRVNLDLLPVDDVWRNQDGREIFRRPPLDEELLLLPVPALLLLAPVTGLPVPGDPLVWFPTLLDDDATLVLLLASSALVDASSPPLLGVSLILLPVTLLVMRTGGIVSPLGSTREPAAVAAIATTA